MAIVIAYSEPFSLTASSKAASVIIVADCFVCFVLYDCQ